jgi:hypothetical protein
VDERPVWRQFFEAWEKAVGPRLEEYVQTDDFAERMTAFQQANRRMTEMNEEASRQFLRSWNLPTASDFEKLTQQVADIDRRLRALSQRVDQAAPALGPRKRQGSKTPAGMKAALESRQAAAMQADASSAAGTAETEKPLPARTSKSAKSSASSQKAKSHHKAGSRNAAAASQKSSTGSEVGEVGVSPASGHRDSDRVAGNNSTGKA